MTQVPLRQQQSVVVVDDDAIVRRWVEMSVAGSEFRVCGVATCGAEASAVVARRRPDLLLVDYRLPDETGSELVRRLRLEGFDTPALLMTANAETGLNETAREAGAQGTILKTGQPEELVYALRRVARTQPAFDSRNPRRAPGRSALTPREREVLRLVAGGATNPEVARTLGVGVETVKTLIARTFLKLGTRRRAEAVFAAQQLGLL